MVNNKYFLTLKSFFIVNFACNHNEIDVAVNSDLIKN